MNQKDEDNSATLQMPAFFHLHKRQRVTTGLYHVSIWQTGCGELAETSIGAAMLSYGRKKAHEQGIDVQRSRSAQTPEGLAMEIQRPSGREMG